MMQLDIKLFHLINDRLACPFLDFLFVFMTAEKGWIPLLIGGIILLSLFGGKRGRITSIALLLGVAIADGTASGILKPLIGRLRPFYELDSVRLIWSVAGKYSCPSNHAANAATIATVLACFYRKSAWVAPIVAFLVGFSRIYVGVHYPLDVMTGFLLGIIAGLISSYILKKAFCRKNNESCFRKNILTRKAI